MYVCIYTYISSYASMYHFFLFGLVNSKKVKKLYQFKTRMNVYFNI